MNKQELQEKLNALLVGENGGDMVKLCRLVENDFTTAKWLDNSQGYFMCRFSGYTISICYKRIKVVSFEIKRHRDLTSRKYVWSVKEVIVENDFVDFDTHIAQAKEILANWYKNDDEWCRGIYDISNNDLRDIFRAIKQTKPNLTAEELRRLVSELNSRFWTIEEAESENK